MAYQLIQSLKKQRICVCGKLLAKRNPSKWVIKAQRVFFPDRPDDLIVRCGNCGLEHLIN
jgi:hypothetical protein